MNGAPMWRVAGEQVTPSHTDHYDSTVCADGTHAYSLLRSVYHPPTCVSQLVSYAGSLGLFLESAKRQGNRTVTGEGARTMVHVGAAASMFLTITSIVAHGVILTAVRAGTAAALVIDMLQRVVANKQVDCAHTVCDVDGTYRRWPFLLSADTGEVLNPYRLNISLRNMQRTVVIAQNLGAADIEGRSVALFRNSTVRCARFFGVLELDTDFVERVIGFGTKTCMSKASLRGVQATGGIELSPTNVLAWNYCYMYFAINHASKPKKQKASVHGDDRPTASSLHDTLCRKLAQQRRAHLTARAQATRKAPSTAAQRQAINQFGIAATYNAAQYLQRGHVVRVYEFVEQMQDEYSQLVTIWSDPHILMLDDRVVAAYDLRFHDTGAVRPARLLSEYYCVQRVRTQVQPGSHSNAVGTRRRQTDTSVAARTKEARRY